MCSKRGGWCEHFCPILELTADMLGGLGLFGAPDSYFSLNTFSKPKRTNNNALFLNAVWVDLDPADKSGSLDFWYWHVKSECYSGAGISQNSRF